MAKKYVCDICQEEFVYDRKSQLVEKAKTHAKEEHETDMEESEIRKGIIDT